MLNSWLPALPATIAAALVLVLPGAVVGRILGARGLTWAAVSAPLSITLIALAAIAGGLVRVPWNVWVLVGFTALAAALSVLLMWFLRKRGWLPEAEAGRTGLRSGRIVHILSVALGLLLAAAFMMRRLAQMIGVPEHFSQRYDNVFHLNAIRYILDTGKGSSLTLTGFDPTNNPGFYPGAWHDTVSLVAQLSGADIPLAVNGTTVALLTLVWPLACFLLTRALVPSTAGSALTTSAVCCAFAFFPLHLLDWGTLYPNLLSLVLLPVALALALAVFQSPFRAWRRRVVPAVLLVVVLPGAGLAHPSAILTLLLLGSVLFAVLWWRELRRFVHMRGLRRFLWFTAALAAYLVVFVVLWLKLRPSKFGAHWPPVTSPGRALGEALTFSMPGLPEAWFMTLLVVSALVILLRQHRAPWFVMWFALTCLLYVSATGMPDSPYRDFLTQTWYHDFHRLAALNVVLAIPLAAFTLWAIWGFISKVLTRALAAIGATGPSVLKPLAAVLAVVLAGGFGLALQNSTINPNLNSGVLRGQWAFRPDFPKNLLSSDEEKLLRRLDREVPAGSVLIGLPSSGAALAYAYTGRSVILPAMGSTPSPDDLNLTTGLNSLDTDPSVCASAKKLNAMYILDFGTTDLAPSTATYTFPSSADLSRLKKVKLVDQQGQARLYKIEGCR